MAALSDEYGDIGNNRYRQILVTTYQLRPPLSEGVMLQWPLSAQAEPSPHSALKSKEQTSQDFHFTLLKPASSNDILLCQCWVGRIDDNRQAFFGPTTRHVK